MARHNKQVSSWRDEYPVHPCADVFPMLSQPELVKLAEDIKLVGLQHPPVLWEDPKDKDKLWLLDGRNRLEALAMLERHGHPWDGSPIIAAHVKDPASYIISANIRRRHLTKAQQAELIVKAMKATKTDVASVARSVTRDKRGRLQGSTINPLITRMHAEGKKHGISDRTMRIARAKVKRSESAPPQKIGLSKKRPKNHAIPLGTRVKRASPQQPSPEWQGVVLTAINLARQVASDAAIRSFVLTVLDQESIAS